VGGEKGGSKSQEELRECLRSRRSRTGKPYHPISLLSSSQREKRRIEQEQREKKSSSKEGSDVPARKKRESSVSSEGNSGLGTGGREGQPFERDETKGRHHPKALVRSTKTEGRNEDLQNLALTRGGQEDQS